MRADSGTFLNSSLVPCDRRPAFRALPQRRAISQLITVGALPAIFNAVFDALAPLGVKRLKCQQPASVHLTGHSRCTCLAGASIKAAAQKFAIDYHALRRHWMNHASPEARAAKCRH